MLLNERLLTIDIFPILKGQDYVQLKRIIVLLNTMSIHIHYTYFKILLTGCVS